MNYCLAVRQLESLFNVKEGNDTVDPISQGVDSGKVVLSTEASGISINTLMGMRNVEEKSGKNCSFHRLSYT